MFLIDLIEFIVKDVKSKVFLLRPVRMVSCVQIVAILMSSAHLAGQRISPKAEKIINHAISEFNEGRVMESVVEFDRLVGLIPEYSPYLWQRGIALYYVGRYDDCVTQFESHRTVNPNDVENAAWHFLCVAKLRSPEIAKQRLLPVGPDARMPMRHIYQMFNGSITPADVMSNVGDELRSRFYAHLYIGIFFESQGKTEAAREHITIASSAKYERAGGYMHRVSQLHLRAFGLKD